VAFSQEKGERISPFFGGDPDPLIRRIIRKVGDRGGRHIRNAVGLKFFHYHLNLWDNWEAMAKF